jgi:hypothetical protein
MEHVADLNGIHINPEVIKGKLNMNRIFFVAQRRVEAQDVLYFSCRTDSGVVILLEVTFQIGQPLQICIRSQEPSIAKTFEATVDRILRQ